VYDELLTAEQQVCLVLSSSPSEHYIVNGRDNVVTRILSFCLCACVPAARRHNDNDVIISLANCVLSVTSPAATLAAIVNTCLSGTHCRLAVDPLNFAALLSVV